MARHPQRQGLRPRTETHSHEPNTLMSSDLSIESGPLHFVLTLCLDGGWPPKIRSSFLSTNRNLVAPKSNSCLLNSRSSTACRPLAASARR